MRNLIRSLYLLLITTISLNAQPQLGLWISPDPYHQNHEGMVPYPCDTSYYIFYHRGLDTFYITAKNEGDEILSLQDILTRDNSDASFTVSGSYPIDILPGEMHVIEIIYQLPSEYHSGINGGLTIYSNDPDGPCDLDFEVGCVSEWKVRDQDLFGISTYTPCSDAVLFVGVQGVGIDAAPGISRFVGSDSLFFYTYSTMENTSYLTMQLLKEGVYVPDGIGVGRNPDHSMALIVQPATNPLSLGSIQMYADATIEGYLTVRKSVAIDSSLYVDGELEVLGTFVESDEKLKTDLKPVTHALPILASLRPYTYFWNDPSRTDQMQYGFSAQEVEQLLPELVRLNRNNNKSVNYTQMIPLLTAALQEQQEAIKNLQSMVEELQKKVH